MMMAAVNEAKLRELLHKICLHEIKLCSDASKEFVKLLKGETGGDLLRLYFQKSPEFAELKEAWEVRQGKQGLSYIFLLIQTILSHPEGKDRSKTGFEIARGIDKLGSFIVDGKLDDVYNELNSKVGKRQNAALSLLASIVRRGYGEASKIANVFDFKSFAKLGEYKTWGDDKVRKHSTRRAFVGFAMSFIEVANPKFLESVLHHKEMYSRVLGGLGNDDEDTVASVLSSLDRKILDSSISPGKLSVLFGRGALQQLVSISARDDGVVNELAHDILVKVCTDPSNGLMPDAKRKLKGNSDRLLMLMKMLRATEVGYHKNLLLAIVRAKPSLASAFFDEFPYNVENFASPSWFSSISLAASLVSSVRISCSFDFLNPDRQATPPSGGLDVQTIMKCICPRPFSRSLITKGMLHPDFLVKHGTLRFLLETLRLLDSFVTAWNLCSSRSCSVEQIQASIEQDVMGEVRNFLPDSQVLLKSLGGFDGAQKVPLKRKAASGSGLAGRKKRIRGSEKNVFEEESGDIVIGGVGFDEDIFLAEDTQMTDLVDAEKEYLGIVSEIWPPDVYSKPIDSVEEAEMCFHIKLLDALRIYVRAVHNVREEFDAAKFLSSSSELPADLQRAILSLLNECISWTPTSQHQRVTTRIPPLMFEQLPVLMNFLLFSPDNEVKDLAYNLAVVAMSSTGAFDKNPSEIGAWFLFLPGFGMTKLPRKVQEAVQSMSSVVITFLCDVVKTVANQKKKKQYFADSCLFKHWDIVRRSLSDLKGTSIGFSPLIVCLLQNCLRCLNSESNESSIPEKTAISLYVCSTLKYLLQTQADSRSLSCLVQSILSEVVDGSKDALCEWRPLRMLLLFSRSLAEKNPFILHSRRRMSVLADTSFTDTLDEIKGLLGSISPDEIAGIGKAFYSALLCATPESILKNVAPVMALSLTLFGTAFSFLHSIAFLEENFLGNLSKLSPDLFVRGSELTGSKNLLEGSVDSEIDFCDHSSRIEEIKSKLEICDIESSAFYIFLEQAPFSVLLTTLMSMDISCLPEFPRISELLLVKVLQPRGGSIELNIQLILFWLFQIRSSYKVQPDRVLCQLSEICVRLMKHLFTKISELEPVSGPASDKLITSPVKWKHQVAETVLCHPAVMAMLESPLDNDKSPRGQTAEVFPETSLATRSLDISEIDQNILDLVASTCDHLFDEIKIVGKGYVGKNKSIMAFRALVERLLAEFKVRFELCVGSQSCGPLVLLSQFVHALLRYISPFELLYLARSMLKNADEDELASRNSSLILNLALDIAGGAFEMLLLFSQQPAANRAVYSVLWELDEKSYDSDLIEEVYSMACKFSTSFGLDSADICLFKVGSGIFRGRHNMNYNVHPLNLIFSQIVRKTPEDLIIHCINLASMTRAKILYYIVESSPLHLSVFGNLFYSILSKKQDDYVLTDDQFLMLLPAVLSYITSVFLELEKPCIRCLDMTSVYANILINGFLEWPRFLSGGIFVEKYEELHLSTTEDAENMFNATLLGKALHMFQYHFSFTESPSKKDDLLKVFNSMFPHTSTGKEILDYEMKEADPESIDQMFNVAIRVVAKVRLSKICLFPEDSSMYYLQPAAGCCLKKGSPKTGSNTENLSKPLLNALVNSWQCVVKKSDSLKQFSEGKQDKCWSLCKSLENFILRSILNFLENMCEELVHLDSLPFLEKLMKSVLLYRFGDSKTLKILREIFLLMSRGKYSYAPYIQLLISHSLFTPTISSLSMSSSHTDELFRPVSSILNHLISSSPYSVEVGSCCFEAPGYVNQLELVKILRVLLSKCGTNSGINLKELHFLLLCSYGATLSEIDLEIYKLMHDIELIDAEVDVSETDYLWGKAALKVQEELRVSQDASDVGEATLVDDIRQSLFTENLCVDPKKCALTALFFPYQQSAEVPEKSYLHDDSVSEEHPPVIKDIERYDPTYILRFSVHSLSMGYIEPVEFVSLGLLAIAFVSMSAADIGMRKLGYETLGVFLDALKSSRKNKQAKGLKLLLRYVQNGIEEPWQRIPTVSAVFAAEASLILLDSFHEHYDPVKKRLKSSSALKLKGIPLFHDFFWSSALKFRSQRLWALRLVCVGLKSDGDAQIYIKNSIAETVMSFSSSPLADDETKGLIIQVVRKSVKFHKLARHLVEKCGLFQWCSSFISACDAMCNRDIDTLLVVVLEVITDLLASRNITEWLQRYALEGLMEISSRLYRLLGDGLLSIQENGTAVDLILQILSATLKMSQKRKMYQPHFNIGIEAIFQLFEAVANWDSPQVEATAECGLDAILTSTPPIDIISLDGDKLRRFLLWGTSTALKSDRKKGSRPSKFHQDAKTLAEEPQEETMVAKFLRWLLASVILGKLYPKANDSDHPTSLSKTKPETLLTLLEYFKKRNLKDSLTSSEYVIGEAIVHLQQLLCKNYRVLLPSVVFALSLILLPNDLGTAGREDGGNCELIKSLCSRILCPPEAMPIWRWSYYQAWRDLSSEPATDLEKIDQLHACQHLLLIFSQMLGEKPGKSQQVLLGKSFDMSSVFEWERGLVET